MVAGLVACADDGNDRAYESRRAAERAAELRAASTTMPPGPTTGSGVEGPSATSDVPPTTHAAEQLVEPTGVVIPVMAIDNTFRPEVVEISVGDEVLWENRGANEHDVLSVEGDDWGVEVEDFQPGDVYAHVFTEPGEYRYYCSIHGTADIGMIGTIIVRG